ncbi:MAG TPA: protein kinase [Sandaracinaceae bacterium]
MASPAAAEPLARDLTGRRLGRYEVLTQLAQGGMATVYVARAQGVAGFERLVAIKVLHPHLAHDEEFISMFLDEARLAARIRHPNAVGTLDISDTQGDGYFLVMEYVEGDHFGSLLRSAAKGGERLPVPVVARIVMDALAGLDAAHRLTDSSGNPLDLVHRDVSPHNILVGKDGVARITDFGVAKAQVRLSSTRDGQFKGKLSYMAPEQAASGTADQRSDLFSMGIVLWEALTGRRLFRGENNAEVLNKILNAEVPPPSIFDASLAPFDPVLARALAREPDERYQSAEAFLEAIEQAASSCGGVATARGVAREVERWLGDKMAAEHAAIRNAMEALGHSDVTRGVLPRPVESGSQPSQPQSRIRSIPPDEPTVGAKPSTVQSATPHRPGKLVAAIVACVLALGLLVGGGAAWLLFAPGAPDASVAAEAAATEPQPRARADAEPRPSAAPSAAAGRREGSTADERSTADEENAAVPSAEVERRAEPVEASADPTVAEPRRAEARRRARQNARRRQGERREDDPREDDVLANPYSR